MNEGEEEETLTSRHMLNAIIAHQNTHDRNPNNNIAPNNREVLNRVPCSL